MNPAWKLRRGAPGVKPELLDRIVFGTLLLRGAIGFISMTSKLRHAMLMTPFALATLMVLLLTIAAFLSVRWAFWVWAVFLGLSLFSDVLLSVGALVAPRLFVIGIHASGLGVGIDCLELIYVVWRLSTWTQRPEPKPSVPDTPTQEGYVPYPRL